MTLGRVLTIVYVEVDKYGDVTIREDEAHFTSQESFM